MIVAIVSILLTASSLLYFFNCNDIVYIQKEEYGKVNGVGSVFNDGPKVSLSTADILGNSTQIFLYISLLFLAVALLCAFSKKTRIISIVITFLLAIIGISFPIGFPIGLKEDMEFIKSDFATYGTGTDAGISGGGWFSILLSLVALGFGVYAFVKAVQQNAEVSEKDKEKLKNMEIDDFKIL